MSLFASYKLGYFGFMNHEHPVLIQGGMGVAVSDWRLARAVSEAGGLGVVSGTALDNVMIRRLQLGDPEGHIRRALDAFPVPEVAASLLELYFIEGGKDVSQRFKVSSMDHHEPTRQLEDLVVAANFVEVFLAKEGHSGPVGINYLEKLQSPTLASLYGSMLAGIDYVLMGAGIPRAIPAILDRLAEGTNAEMKLDVKGANREDNFGTRFDPQVAMRGQATKLKRPQFLAIVSSHILATMLVTKVEVPVDGLIVEGPTAGGHNAPPRGKLTLSGSGEPIYGARDVPDLEAIRELGLPFWLAGGYLEPEQVADALALGATGVQVGTPFAYCEESGFTPEAKQQVLKSSREGTQEVFTDPAASPSGFPFKVVQVEGTLSDSSVYENRSRTKCELGYLRTGYRKDDGEMGWRCPSEPEAIYLRKGGKKEDMEDRKCVCTALLANVGLGQTRTDGSIEPMLITSGDSVADVARFLEPGASSYRAADVIERLLPKP